MPLLLAELVITACERSAKTREVQTPFRPLSILKRQNKQLARTLADLSADEDFDITEFEKEAKPVSSSSPPPVPCSRTPEKFAGSRREAWERLSSIIDETRNLGEAWPKLGRRSARSSWITGSTTSRSSGSPSPA
jgi:hypothetical protein